MDSERGQALLEMAVVLPLLVGIFFAIAQVGLLYNTKQMMYMAAHHGVLIAASGGDGVFGARNLLVENGIAESRITSVEVQHNGNLVTLTIQCLVPSLFGFEPIRQREYTLTAQVTMGRQLIPRFPGNS